MDNWKTVVDAPRERDEPIHLLEGRAVLAVLRTSLRSCVGGWCRRVCLADTLGVAVPCAKGRASDAPLLQLCRQNAAYFIASGVKLIWRWTSADLNHAVEPSCLFPTYVHIRADIRIKNLRRLSALNAHKKKPTTSGGGGAHVAGRGAEDAP